MRRLNTPLRPVRRLESPLLALLALVTGCSLLCPFPSVDVIQSFPEPLRGVAASSDDFRQLTSDRLRGVTAGTVREDLTGLEGCFGAVDAFESGLGLLPNIEAYRFDAATGTLIYQVYQCGTVVNNAWSFEFVANNALRVNRELPDGTVQAAIVDATLDGEELKIAFVRDDGNFLDGGAAPSDDQRTRLVFHKFPCPESLSAD